MQKQTMALVGLGVALIAATVWVYAETKTWSRQLLNTQEYEFLNYDYLKKAGKIISVQKTVKPLKESTTLDIEGKIQLSFPKRYSKISIAGWGNGYLLCLLTKNTNYHGAEKDNCILISLMFNDVDFREHIRCAEKMLIREFGENKTRYIGETIEAFLKQSQEKWFLAFLSHGVEDLKNAGKDRQKAIIAFTCLDARHSLSLDDPEFSCITLDNNKVYIQTSPSVSKTRYRIWVFNKKGVLLGHIDINKSQIDTGLQIADSMSKADGVALVPAKPPVRDEKPEKSVEEEKKSGSEAEKQPTDRLKK